MHINANEKINGTQVWLNVCSNLLLFMCIQKIISLFFIFKNSIVYFYSFTQVRSFYI